MSSNYIHFSLNLNIAGAISGFSRPAKKAPDSLYVMANHGQLLEYSLDPVPDPSKLATRGEEGHSDI